MSSTESEVRPSKRRCQGWQKAREDLDGCFDMMHFGHANALRQAKQFGDFLVVGVHSDAEITHHKGPTVMTEQERYAAVAACKWVDLVVPDAPYLTSLEVMNKYDCDFCVHGDDITTLADGTDCYQLVKDAGRYRECKRTQGVSTTELVGRMLLMSREHLRTRPGSAARNAQNLENFTGGGATASHFLPTTRRLGQFADGREPKAGDKVVYVDGGFDLFHVGHIEFLKKAKALGDYLLVGVHDDQVVNTIKGSNYPIMNLHERVLSVLSCRYVDEVIIGAPYSVTKDVLEKVYSVHVVVHGSTAIDADTDGQDPYKLPKELGIYKAVESPQETLTTDTIVDRIIEHRTLYEARNRRKAEKAAIEAAMEEEAKRKK